MLSDIINIVNSILHKKDKAILAIDGRCASGKTTLASQLHQHFNSCIFHIDDFYVPLEERTAENEKLPGGHIDYYRFIEEVLKPLQEKRPFVYKIYRHNPSSNFQFSATILPHNLSIVEGSYSCHPALRHFYDYTLFLSVNEQVQLERLKRREDPEHLANFLQYWVPREEHYFQTYRIAEICHFFWENNVTKPISE
ncbi:MAG: uridine kinase [Candidatus Bruticola sp.]